MAVAVSGFFHWTGWFLRLQRRPVTRCQLSPIPWAFHASALAMKSSDAQKYQSPPSSSQQHSEPQGTEEPNPESSRSIPRYADQGGEEDEDCESEEQLQHRIPTAASHPDCSFVPAHGWTSEAIVEGAQSLGLASTAAGMFGNDGNELVLHFVTPCNATLNRVMEEEQTLVQSGLAEKGKTDWFLRDAVETRLRMLIPYVEHWLLALSMLVLPHTSQPVCTSSPAWWMTCDTVQGTSPLTVTGTHVEQYSLASTELVMMQDSSPDFEDTWRFLENRINDAMNVGHTAKRVKSPGEALSKK